MCDVRFGDRPRDYRLFEKSPENEPTCVGGSLYSLLQNSDVDQVAD